MTQGHTYRAFVARYEALEGRGYEPHVEPAPKPSGEERLRDAAASLVAHGVAIVLRLKAKGMH